MVLVVLSICWLPIIQGIMLLFTCCSIFYLERVSLYCCLLISLHPRSSKINAIKPLDLSNFLSLTSNIFLFQGSAGTQLFVYIQKIQSYLSPPITMVFTLGILWPGLTAAGALSGLLVGFLLGMAKFIVGNVYPDPRCGDVDSRPGFAKMHFMYYGKRYLLPELCWYFILTIRKRVPVIK